VHDYRPALDYFFEVVRTGYNLGDAGHEISTLIPKDLGVAVLQAPERHGLHYAPPERPDDGVISKVYVHQENAELIRQRLAQENRADLRTACEWLLERPEVNFTFQPAGKLRQRDTSVWPIAAIETWPSWLREALFGSGIDIESAYTQYLMEHLREAHADSPSLLQTLYPDLIRSVTDKTAWRHELCAVLGMEPTEDAISTVKRVCMSLANGSLISPAILSRGGTYSVTADIVIKATTDVSVDNLDTIGRRLQAISRQYSSARRAVCLSHLHLKPTRRNQKRVFGSYFEWERVARYLIWEAVERHGIMVHDGIDGIPEQFTRDLPALIQKIGLRVTA